MSLRADEPDNAAQRRPCTVPVIGQTRTVPVKLSPGPLGQEARPGIMVPATAQADRAAFVVSLPILSERKIGRIFDC